MPISPERKRRYADLFMAGARGVPVSDIREQRAQRQREAEKHELAKQKLAAEVGATNQEQLKNMMLTFGRINAMAKTKPAQAIQTLKGIQQTLTMQKSPTVQGVNAIVERIDAGDIQGAFQQLESAAGVGQALYGNADQLALKSYEPRVDEKGDLYIPVFDPNSQTVTKKYLGVKGETPQQKTEREVSAQGREVALKAAVDQGKAAFESLPKIRGNIGNLSEAIRAIDKGADTGYVESFFPSITAASIELDNVRSQLGLDVVGNTTFGALSESELEMALETALPTNLQEGELRKWLIKKRKAQQKVAKELQRVASLLAGGQMTISEYIDREQKAGRMRPIKERQTPSKQVPPAASGDDPYAGVSDAELEAQLRQLNEFQNRQLRFGQ